MEQTIIKQTELLVEFASQLDIPDSLQEQFNKILAIARDPYDPKYKTEKYQEKGNRRHPNSKKGNMHEIVGALDCVFRYPTSIITMPQDKHEQTGNKIDLYIDKMSIQIKSGQQGRQGDIYCHRQWLSGKAHYMAAVVRSNQMIHFAPLDGWRQCYAKVGYCHSLDGKAVWIPQHLFQKHGGKLYKIDSRILEVLEKGGVPLE